MSNKKYNCLYTDNIVCPYCGHENSDSHEIEFDDEYITCQCEECEKELNVRRTISVSYSTTCIEHDYFESPSDKYPDRVLCSRCDEISFKRYLSKDELANVRKEEVDDFSILQ